MFCSYLDKEWRESHKSTFRLENKISFIEDRLEEMDITMKNKEDLKTVALGTSKINYLDPRITVAWCKTHEVPIEKVP
jgi:DNA topoisomerase-1